MSSIANMIAAQNAAKNKAAGAASAPAGPESFRTREQNYGSEYTHAPSEDDEKDTLGGTKRKGGASRAILG